MFRIEKVYEAVSGYAVFRMRAESLEILVTNLGCRVLSIKMPDRNGTWNDIILGLLDPEHPGEDGTYMGAVVGRVVNRIRGASFDLNGRTYALSGNDGRNHLHGGSQGFDKKMFTYLVQKDAISFGYKSPDMEEGYPGNLQIVVTYRLEGNTFTFDCLALSDADTLVNISNHMYFNLSGRETPIWDHSLMIAADCFLPIDEESLPTGERRSVAGTAFDYRRSIQIAHRIDTQDAQIRKAHGYDHAFCLNRDRDQILLRHPESGRQLRISTDCPMLHVYTGNFLSEGSSGKKGKPYDNWGGIALEPELCPDSIHMENEPQVILRKNKLYHTTTTYRFEVKE